MAKAQVPPDRFEQVLSALAHGSWYVSTAGSVLPTPSVRHGDFEAPRHVERRDSGL